MFSLRWPPISAQNSTVFLVFIKYNMHLVILPCGFHEAMCQSKVPTHSMISHLKRVLLQYIRIKLANWHRIPCNNILVINYILHLYKWLCWWQLFKKCQSNWWLLSSFLKMWKEQILNSVKEGDHVILHLSECVQIKLRWFNESGKLVFIGCIVILSS